MTDETLTKEQIRNLTWGDYGISKKRQKELKCFCEQYHEKKSRTNGEFIGRTKGVNETMLLERISDYKDCLLMEEAAVRANPSIYHFILKSVANDFSYEKIEYDEETGKIPYGRTDFYGYRRLFFYLLHRLKIGEKLNVVM